MRIQFIDVWFFYVIFSDLYMACLIWFADGIFGFYNLANCGGSSDLLIRAMAAFIKSSLCNMDLFQWACNKIGE